MKNRTHVGLAGIAAAAAAFSIAGAGTALARTYRPLIGRGSITGAVPSTPSNTDPIYAGYDTVIPAGTTSTASVTFRVPAFTCPAKGDPPTAGVLSGFIDQNGYNLATGGVEFECNVGGIYALVAEGTDQSPGTTSTDVAAHDLVTVALYTDTTGGALTTVDDQTSGAIIQNHDPAGTTPAGQLISALWDQSAGREIPKFGSIPFTSAFADGAPLGVSTSTPQDLQNNGDVQAHTSAITGGTKFTVTFKHRT